MLRRLRQNSSNFFCASGVNTISLQASLQATGVTYCDGYRRGNDRLNERSRLQANIAKGAEHAGGPAVDVVFHDLAAHVLHAIAPFGTAHIEATMHGFCDSSDVIGIDDERVGQFDSSASELAEDERAIFIVAGGDVLFRDRDSCRRAET